MSATCQLCDEGSVAELMQLTDCECGARALICVDCTKAGFDLLEREIEQWKADHTCIRKPVQLRTLVAAT